MSMVSMVTFQLKGTFLSCKPSLIFRSCYFTQNEIFQGTQDVNLNAILTLVTSPITNKLLAKHTLT
jgi:hypothetical protein